jgi:hypothetical protein
MAKRPVKAKQLKRGSTLYKAVAALQLQGAEKVKLTDGYEYNISKLGERIVLERIATNAKC